MIIFFSGKSHLCNPEEVLANPAIMLTYAEMRNGPNKRFRKVLKLRRRAKKKERTT